MNPLDYRGLPCPPPYVRTLRVLDTLDLRKESQFFFRGADATYCTSIIGRYDTLAGQLERALVAGAELTPKQIACVLKLLRRMLNRHRVLSRYTALDP